MVFVVPGENDRPDEVKSLGAPVSALNWPLVPVTRLCVPPVELGSSKTTDCPAEMEMLVLPVKLDPPNSMVLPPLDPPPPHAASSSGVSSASASAQTIARRPCRAMCSSYHSLPTSADDSRTSHTGSFDMKRTT